MVLTSYTHTANAQNYSWTQLNDYGGAGRLGGFNFVIDNLGYIGAGYGINAGMTDVWQFDPSNTTWTQKSDYPLAVRATGHFALDGMGYVVCGLAGSSSIQNSVYAYDPDLNTWTAKADFPGVPIYGGASFAINGKGYYGIGNAGSQNGPYYNEFYEYDPAADSWTQVATFPGLIRYGTYGFSINDKGYAGFGGDDANNVRYNDWFEYDAPNNTWTQKATLPGFARSYPSGFVLNDLGYLVCGLIYPGFNTTEVFKYDPVNDSWNPLQNFPGAARWIASGFAIADTGYFGTGRDNNSTDLNDFWKFAPDSLTGLNEVHLGDVSIYPNPAADYIYLESDQFENFQILNIEGKVIQQINVEDLKTSKIDISHLSTGIYFVRINSINNSTLNKFVKL